MMLELQNISRNFGNFRLSSVSFRVDKGDYFILLGPSGSGKSLLLELIAGLIIPESGRLLLNGTDITRQKIQQRKIGLVFQDQAVFPHLTVRKNLEYPLVHLPGKERFNSISEKADQLGIKALLNRMPGSLSGGELQRVALARTLLQDPVILLLDEPMSSVDALLKPGIRRMLRDIHREGQTIIHVTHDYEEALSLATRIAVIDQGVILQTGTPDEVLHHPKTEFVAGFVGVRNFLPVTLFREGDCTVALTPNQLKIAIETGSAGEKGFLLIRGEDIFLSRDPIDSSASNNFRGVVREITRKPHGYEVTIAAGETFHALITRASAEKLEIRTGEEFWVHFKAFAIKLIPA